MLKNSVKRNKQVVAAALMWTQICYYHMHERQKGQKGFPRGIPFEKVCGIAVPPKALCTMYVPTTQSECIYEYNEVARNHITVILILSYCVKLLVNVDIAKSRVTIKMLYYIRINVRSSY